MKPISGNQLRDLVTDLEVELNRLEQLEQGITQVRREIAQDSQRMAFFYES